jgi:hypothetical protein
VWRFISKLDSQRGATTMANQMSQTESGKYPLDNLTYDLISIIHNKSEALVAYDRYLQDAQSNERIRRSIEKLRLQDQECISELCEHLSHLLGQQTQSNSAGQAAMAGGSKSAAKR